MIDWIILSYMRAIMQCNGIRSFVLQLSHKAICWSTPKWFPSRTFRWPWTICSCLIESLWRAARMYNSFDGDGHASELWRWRIQWWTSFQPEFSFHRRWKLVFLRQNLSLILQKGLECFLEQLVEVLVEDPWIPSFFSIHSQNHKFC